jgi:hypothetical protein
LVTLQESPGMLLETQRTELCAASENGDSHSLLRDGGRQAGGWIGMEPEGWE